MTRRAPDGPNASQRAAWRERERIAAIISLETHQELGKADALELAALRRARRASG